MSPTPRTFVAQTTLGRRAMLVVGGAQLGLVVVLGAIANLLPIALVRVVVPVALLAGAVAYLAWFTRGARGRALPLLVDGGRVLVDDGRGGAFPIASAAIGPWRAPHLGVVTGTVLHLEDGARTIAIGGADFRPPPGTAEPRPAVSEVDAHLPSHEFAALLHALGGAGVVAPDAGYRAGPPEARHLALAPNPAAIGTAFGKMVPWFATMGVVSVLGVVLGSSPLTSTPVGSAIVGVILFAVVAVGLGLTIARSMATPITAELRLRDGALELVELPGGRVVGAGVLGTFAVTPGFCRFTVKGMTFEYPVVTMLLGVAGPVCVGVYDPRFLWPRAVPRVSAPRHVLGPPDWLVLTTALGLGADVPRPPGV
jgi:hypothetical protein